MDNTWLYISIIASVISIGVAVFLYFGSNGRIPGRKSQEVASWIREGAQTYLKRLYFALSVVAIILGFIIAIVFSFDLADVAAGQATIQPLNGIRMAIAFISGSLCSAIAGYMGMGIAVEANVRTATAANESLNKAFKLSFYAGSVMGLAMVGLAVLGMTVLFLITGEAETVLGFSFGASAWRCWQKPVAAFIPRRLILQPTWWARSKSGFRKMIPVTRQWLPITLVITSVMSLVWARIFRLLCRIDGCCHAFGCGLINNGCEIRRTPADPVYLGYCSLINWHSVCACGEEREARPSLEFWYSFNYCDLCRDGCLLVLLSDINIGILWPRWSAW